MLNLVVLAIKKLAQKKGFAMQSLFQIYKRLFF